MNERLIELETQLAFQDGVIQELNDVVISQQQQLDLLKREMQLLREQFASLNDKMVSSGNEPPPPHY